MLKQTCTYVFEKYFKYKQLCGNSQELFQTLAIIFSKERLVSINEINAGIFFFYLSTRDCATQMLSYVYTKSWENKHKARDTDLKEIKS